MSSIIFGYTMSLTTAATPSTGFLVAYDEDGILKQKDSFGVITAIAGSSSGVSGTYSFAQVLSISNDSESNSILMGTATSIQMGSASSITTQNGLSSFYLDYQSATSSVYLTNGYNYLHINNATMSMVNGLGNSINISNGTNFMRMTSTFSDVFSLNEIKFRVYNSSDEILLKSNIGTSVSSQNSTSNAIFIGSQNSQFNANIINSVILGGIGQSAVVSNSVYIPDTYIQDTKKLRGSSGNSSLRFTDTNNLILENSSSLLAIISSSSSTTLTTNGLIVSDTSAGVTSPDLDSSTVFISTRNSSFDAGVKNSVIIGGENLVSSLTNSVVLGGYVNINNQYTLPDTDGSVDYVLSTNGSGTVSWQPKSNQTLAQVLANGDNTGTYSIVIGSGSSIYGQNGGQINLDYSSNSVLISTDFAAFDKSFIQLEDENIYVDANSELLLSSATISVVTTNNSGIVYGFDYSSSFITYSLVDKNYVDLGTSSIWSMIDSINNDFVSEVTAGLGLTGGGTSGTVNLEVNVDNGLSIISDNVVLGGTLSQNTTIDGLTLYSTYINNLNNFEVTSKGSSIESDNSSHIKAGNSTSYSKVYTNGSTAYLQNYIGGNTYSQVLTYFNGINFEAYDGSISNIFRMTFTPESINDGSVDNSMIIEDNQNSKGLVYYDDYSSNFTTYSLVTKGWVSSNTTDKYSVTMGFTSSITETITHGLGTDEIIVQAYDSSGVMVIPGTVQINGLNDVDITFSSTLSNIKIIVIG